MAESSGSVTSRRGEANDGPIEDDVDQVEAESGMKLRYSSLKAALLGTALLLLSAKGAQELAIDESFSLVVNLPAWLVALKQVVTPVAAALMGGFVALAILSRKQLTCTPLFAGYVAVLAYYFLRSAWLGSNVQGNLLALVILFAFSLAISLDFGTNRARGTGSYGWMTPLSYFCHGYVVVTFSLLAAGYGYAQVGARFLGMTYHPNAEGAFAALCAGLFVARFYRTGIGLRQRLIECFFLSLALLLVVASGSRTATLMALLAFCCLVPVRFSVVAIVVAFAVFYLAPGIATSEGDATIGGAITRMLNATTGNRQEVWGRLISDFYAHPFFGVGDTSNVSGSGFLTAFAGDGVFGGLLFLLVMAVAVKQSVGVIFKFRRGRGWNARLVAAVLMLQILLGAVFEGALFDKFSPFPLLAMIFLMAMWTKDQDGRLAVEVRVP
jgi:hypothetical protein